MVKNMEKKKVGQVTLDEKTRFKHYLNAKTVWLSCRKY